MPLDKSTIESIYAGKVAKNYDRSMSHMFGRFKKLAIQESSLKKGDRVVVFCCGTGSDFPYILDKIGSEGTITGIDFSPAMLKLAQAKVKKNNWKNIELIESDITLTNEKFNNSFDAGICTLGLSIIPNYKTAYTNLISYVKQGGEIIIGDMQLASGGMARFNPITLFLAKRFGGTHDGHQNSLEIRSFMQSDLNQIRQREFFFRSYYYCIGKTE